MWLTSQYERVKQAWGTMESHLVSVFMLTWIASAGHYTIGNL